MIILFFRSIMSFKFDLDKNGGLNYLVNERTKKCQPVFLLPSVQVHQKHKNELVMSFSAHLFGLKEPNVTTKTIAVLKRLKMTEKQMTDVSQSPCEDPSGVSQSPSEDSRDVSHGQSSTQAQCEDTRAVSHHGQSSSNPCEGTSHHPVTQSTSGDSSVVSQSPCEDPSVV